MMRPLRLKPKRQGDGSWMPPPAHIQLGELTRALLGSAVWTEESQFPAHQPWADDFERILRFVDKGGALSDLWPRLLAREREGAIAAARVAYFLGSLGFTITSWHPIAVAGRPGDIEIRWDGMEPVFVEVKGPGWEAELSEKDLAAGRQRAPKHVHLEARSVDSVGPTLRAIDKALPKLSNQRCNLVAVCEDLFISPVDLPPGWLDSYVAEHLRNPERLKVSAVLLLNTQLTGSEVEYRTQLCVNTAAVRPLPGIVANVLSSHNAP
jgi:hypothetical protein